MDATQLSEKRFLLDQTTEKGREGCQIHLSDGFEMERSVFSFQANARALTMDSPEGLVKIVAGPDDRILGAHILGPDASDLIAELTLAMHNRLTIRDVASAVHIHPTLSEAVMEAALKVRGEAIHVLNS